MKILGIDPGDTTGYCWLTVDKIGPHAKIVVEEVGEVENDGYQSWVSKNFNRANVFLPKLVVCEDFIKRPDKGNNQWMVLSTAKKIGNASQRAFDIGATYVELQASDKPTGYRAAKLQYVKGKKGMHIQDATAHAFYIAKFGFTKTQKRF